MIWSVLMICLGGWAMLQSIKRHTERLGQPYPANHNNKLKSMLPALFVEHLLWWIGYLLLFLGLGLMVLYLIVLGSFSFAIFPAVTLLALFYTAKKRLK